MKKGVLVVVAAGNEGINHNDSTDYYDYPCSSAMQNVLCVAALDQKLAIAEWSNYGTNSVDIGAPGVNIFSTYTGKDVMLSIPASGWTPSGLNLWVRISIAR